MAGKVHEIFIIGLLKRFMGKIWKHEKRNKKRGTP
jgi:hypothetical protein